MGNLLKADFFRIFRSKMFMIVCILSGAFPFLTAGLYFLVSKIVKTAAMMPGMGSQMFTARMVVSDAFVLSSNMGLLLPIFITVFICADVSNGTLRNKIIAGRSRTSIYFSHLISSSVISAVLILLEVLLFLGISCLIFGYGAPFDANELLRLVFFFVTGVMTFVFSAAISTALSLMMKHTAPAVIITVVAGMGISLISSVVHYADQTLSNRWFCLIPTYTNSVFLNYGKFDAASFLIGLLSYLIFGAAITVLGLFRFRKADLK